MREMMPHQHSALAYATPRKAIALYMEMRLGKTLVAIRWVTSLPLLRRRVLVVAPLAVVNTWREELLKEGVPPDHITLVKGSRKQRLASLSGGIQGYFLMGYEALRVTPEASTAGFTVLICDESTKIRNPKATITRTLLQKFNGIPYKAVLSGLPAPEGPLDYYTQFQFLHGKFMGAHNYWHFRNSYFKLYGFDWVPKPNVLGLIKEAVHRDAFVLTRKQSGIGSRKIYEKRYVQMNAKQRKAYRQVEKEFALTVDNTTIETKWNPVKLSWLQRIAGGFTPPPVSGQISEAKNEELLSLLQGELKGEQVIVWYRFNDELNSTFLYLTKHGIRSHIITGEVALPLRNEHIESFKNKTWKKILPSFGKKDSVKTQMRIGQGFWKKT